MITFLVSAAAECVGALAASGLIALGSWGTRVIQRKKAGEQR